MRTVVLPADLCAAVERQYGSQFNNLESLLIFILERLASDEAQKADETELHIVEQRLKDLGYL